MASCSRPSAVKRSAMLFVPAVIPSRSFARAARFVSRSAASAIMSTSSKYESQMRTGSSRSISSATSPMAALRGGSAGGPSSRGSISRSAPA